MLLQYSQGAPQNAEVCRGSPGRTSISFFGEKERSGALFWILWEFTIGWVLYFLVARKTVKIIKRGLSDEEKGRWRADKQFRERILRQARKNFGAQGKNEVFNMEIPLLTEDSPLMRHFLRHVENAQALDAAYNVNGDFVWRRECAGTAYPPDWRARFHLNFPPAQAVRNRYRVVAEEYCRVGGNALSIACGSAQPLIHAFAVRRDVGARLVLTDASRDALDLALEKADWAGVRQIVETQEVVWTNVQEHLSGRRFDFVEACGIMDYLPTRIAKKLVQMMLAMTSERGRIIVSNVSRSPTGSERLLRKLYNWDLVYRSPEELAGIVEDGGGRIERVVIEPWRMHAIITATRR